MVKNDIESIDRLKKSLFNLFNLILINIKIIFNKYIAIAIFLILWEILSITGFFDPNFISSISTIVTTIWDLTFHGHLIEDSFYTVLRVVIGISLALIVAIPVGFIIGGFYKKLEITFNHLFRILEQFNPLGFFHLLILLTLLNELSIVIVIFWSALWPLINNTVSGAKNVKQIHIKVAKAANLDKFDIFWKIHLPTALPNIFTGLRLGILFGFLMAFGIEMMGMNTGIGLGYFIMNSQMNGQVSYIWAGIATMTLLSLFMTLIINKIENRYIKNKKTNET